MDVRRGREPAGAPRAVRGYLAGLGQARALHQRHGSEGADLYLYTEAFREAFAADVDQATVEVMAAAQRRDAAAAFAARRRARRRARRCWSGCLGTEDKVIRRRSSGSRPSA